MADFKLEEWEREPLWLKLLTPFLKKKRFPGIPEDPQKGKWYRVYPEGVVDANGESTYGSFQIGTENKLLVYFAGGGVSWNEYTAARQSSLYSKNLAEGFYMVHVDLFTDLNLNKGIFEDSDRNPFCNWSKLVLNYNTGDFHVGDGDFPYTALDGSRRVLHHHGFRNYRAILQSVKKWISAPEQLFICGCSGGAFGVSLVSNDLIHQFPECRDVTCLVDSGYFRMEDWHSAARDVWHAPKEIVDCIHSDNIMLDGLEALYKTHGSKIKYLFCCSVRDGFLARMENYLENNEFAFSEESGHKFQKELSELCRELQEKVPGIGMFFFDKVDKRQKDKRLTVHCIIGEKDVYEYVTEEKTVMQWIGDALKGQVKSYGIGLLNGN
ncbi:MAG: pectin acetylesterase-family hydrolase [Eubacteriales bacterium]|nr:pectin acetylesterase-family hydrolase [Eubacteriales bacterium]